MITVESIENDIEGFRARISKAQAKLAELPETAGSYPVRMKLKARHKVLVDEIRHVEGLIRIASDALEGTEVDA